MTAAQTKLFSGQASNYLAENISVAYGESLGNMVFSKFSDGDFKTSFEETVRGKEVFLIDRNSVE